VGILFALVAAEPVLAAGTTDPPAPRVEEIAPPTLPSLTHRDFTLSSVYSGAWIGTYGGPSKGSGYAWIAHADLEYPIEPRKWFFGSSFDLASAAIAGVGKHTLYGNPELWLRGMWSNKAGLSAGGSLGAVIPLPRDLDTAGRGVLRAVEIIRAWDSAYFSDNTATLRPALDMALRFKPIFFQFRQGIDLAYSFLDGGTNILGRTDLFVDFTYFDPVAIGVEVFETYPITAEIPDEHRAAFTISPSVRMRFPGLQAGVSALLPLTKAQGEERTFVALRLHVTFVLDKKPEVVDAKK
jgi:hypothetical protein